VWGDGQVPRMRRQRTGWGRRCVSSVR